MILGSINQLNLTIGTNPNFDDLDSDSTIDPVDLISVQLDEDNPLRDLFGFKMLIVYLAIVGLIMLFFILRDRRIIRAQKRRLSKINTLINDGHQNIKYDKIVEELEFKDKNQFTSWVGKAKNKLPLDLDENDVRLHQEMPSRQKKRYTILIIETKTTDPKRAISFSSLLSTIKKELSFALLRYKYDIKSAEAVEADDLTYHLMTHNPEIVHFYGHSSDDNKIMLYKDESKTVLVKPDDLANLFKLFNKSLRCVILSSCYNDKQAEAIAQYIDCVVGTLKSIEEKSAVSFAQGFYRALGGGKSVNEAFEFGVVQMKLANNKGKPKIIAIKVDPADLVFK